VRKSEFVRPSLFPAQYFVRILYLDAPLHHVNEEEYSTYSRRHEIDWNGVQSAGKERMSSHLKHCLVGVCEVRIIFTL
jgi:hypothetical protein